LEAAKTAWTEAGDTRGGLLQQGAAGDYRFHVIACNEDGVWNETGDALEVTVQPQFWQTWWFRTAVILCLVGTVVCRWCGIFPPKSCGASCSNRPRWKRTSPHRPRPAPIKLGANLTAVALLGEMAEADKNSPAEIESYTQQISQTARETTRSLDEIVWAVNLPTTRWKAWSITACKYAQDTSRWPDLRYRADVPAQLPANPIPPEVRHKHFSRLKEAVNNVVKHAPKRPKSGCDAIAARQFYVEH